MTESKSFNRVSTVILTALVIVVILPILSDCNRIFLGRGCIDTRWIYLLSGWVESGFLLLYDKTRSCDIKILWNIISCNDRRHSDKCTYYDDAGISNGKKILSGKKCIWHFLYFLRCYLMGESCLRIIMWTQIFHIKDTVWALMDSELFGNSI